VSERICPCCFRPYAFRVPRRVGPQMNLKLHYRCGTAGRWLYCHANTKTYPWQHRPPLTPQAARVDLAVGGAP